MSPGIYPRLLILILSGCLLPVELYSQQDFRVAPYLQNPSEDAISIIWFSGLKEPGYCTYRREGTSADSTFTSHPVEAWTLDYPDWEDSLFFNWNAPPVPYKHRIRLTGLEPGTRYHYAVRQGSDTVHSFFNTAPCGYAPIRFMVYADAETEPESTGKFTSWPDPATGNDRGYLIDQTAGYRNNLRIMESRDPDLIFIAGDLVESGGEQRDWDEFWRHNAGMDTLRGPAQHIPILGVPGNHEYYEGPLLGKFEQPGSERAIRKYLAYFETASNHSTDPGHEGRYHSLRYGPASFILLDGCNNGINGSDEDTNFALLGNQDPGGGNAPDFGPGSVQYLWLEAMLRESRVNSLFTFVLFHHAPYSSGPHGFPPGEGAGFDRQSGHPLRVLTPLFMQYGVDAVFSGHDEMWERSVVTGIELLPDGEEVPHSIHFYDLGTGGDGLRGPAGGADNPFREFLVHTDVPEQWDDTVLIAGGKHYGHLEVEIIPSADPAADRPSGVTWQAILSPVYIFPVYDSLAGAYTSFERRIYEDMVVLTAVEQRATSSEPVENDRPGIRVFPNPFTDNVFFRLPPSPGQVMLEIFDISGRKIRTLARAGHPQGCLQWDGLDQSGSRAPSGIYLWQISSSTGIRYQGRICMLN